MNRDEMIEKAVRAFMESDQFCTVADRNEGITEHDQIHYVLDAILPQVETGEELETLPDGAQIIGTDDGGKPQFWTMNRDMRCYPKVYIQAYGPFVVWTPPQPHDG